MMSGDRYSSEMCRKITAAIKKSGIYSHIDPIELIRNHMSDNYVPPFKRVKQNSDESGTFRKPLPPSKSYGEKVKSSPSVVNKVEAAELPVEPSKSNETGESQENTSKILSASCLPSPNNLFLSPESSSSSFLPEPTDMLFTSPVTPEDSKENASDSNVTLKALPPQTGSSSKLCLPDPKEMFLTSHGASDQSLDDLDLEDVAINNNTTKISKSEAVCKLDRPKSKLSNLASTFLPAPSDIFTKSNIIEAIKMKNLDRFSTALKSVRDIDTELLNDDVYEIIQKIIDYKLYTAIGELCIVFKGHSAFAGALSEQFIRNTTLLIKYKNDFLNCLESMIDIEQTNTIRHYVKASIAANEWNTMLKCVLELDNDFKLDNEDFTSLVSIFQNYMNRAIYFSHDTVGLIISYIIRHNKAESDLYMADIWIYCMYHDILNVESGETNDIPESILENVIKKLVNSCTSYIFAQKLLFCNWKLLEDPLYGNWMGRMISDKTSEVRKILQLIHNKLMQHDSRKVHHFYLLSILVMHYLNKKSLFGLSYTVYDFFVKSNLHQLNVIIESSLHERFKMKWSIIEPMINLKKNDEALYILREFKAIEDLEEDSLDYISAKKTLPILVWNLIGSNILDDVADLFQKLISIFVMTDGVEQSYIKNYQNMFESITNKAYENPDKSSMQQLLNLVNSVISWNLKFTFNQETMRKLVIGSLEAGLGFDSLTEYLERPQFKCVLPNIVQESVDNGGGSSVDVPSNLNSNQIYLWIAWIVRTLKIRLVEIAQSDNGHSNHANLLAENLTKICSLTFHLRRLHNNSKNVNVARERRNFQDFIEKFTQILSNPKYLSVPLQYTVLNKASDSATIVLDGKSLYNCIYYSDL